jgi:peptidoglycan/LPS O-acetylase OafA/YrhL
MKKNGIDAAHNTYYGLDTLRALAVIMVILFHYPRWFPHPEWFPEVLKFGWAGVDLFFVLSGFLISSQLFAQIKKQGSFSMREFYIKRFFRILPVYYFVLALYFIFPVLSAPQLLPPLWKFLTFTQNFGANFETHRGFGVVWSLCVEEHFYLLLPLTLLLLLKNGLYKKAGILLLLLFVVGLMVRLYSYYNIYLPQTNGTDNRAAWVATIYYPTYNRLDGLLAGVGIAALYNYCPALLSRLSKYANCIFAAGLLLLTVAYFVCQKPLGFGRSIIGFPLVSIGFGCWVLAAIIPGSFLYNWKSAAISMLARLSFSLYLIHMGVILMVQQLFSNWGIAKESFEMFLFCMACSVGIALMLYFGIEKPFMKMRVRFLTTAKTAKRQGRLVTINTPQRY